MSSDSLENEDLDNVPLVRMEDVQPSRDRPVDRRITSKDDVIAYETCIIDDIECENECVVDDEDSNIGSMVSLQSEDGYEEESLCQEMIIPEVLEEVETENDEGEAEIFIENGEDNQTDYLEEDRLEGLSSELVTDTESYLDMPIEDVEEQLDNEFEAARELKVNTKHYGLHSQLKRPVQEAIGVEIPANKVKRVEQVITTTPSESWPTLEILPGGVIKNTDKYESDSYLYPDKVQETVANTGEMMYACAKCSQTFKYLFCLVKHVKWHEDQKKVTKDPKLVKLKSSSEQYICLHSGKKKIVAAERNKRKTYKRQKS